jgi:hypothetical protein
MFASASLQLTMGRLGPGDAAKLVTRPIKSWIACLYDGLCSSIVRSYTSTYFSHDIRQWAVHVPVGTSWLPLDGKIYRADIRSLDELETNFFRQGSALITGDCVDERVERVLSTLGKRKAPVMDLDLQGREKRVRGELSTGNEGDS